MKKRFALLVSLIIILTVLVPIAGHPIIENTKAESTLTGGSSDPPISELNVPLYVNGFDNTKTGWTRVGTSPYLDAVDYSTNYIYHTKVGAEIGNFFFEDVASYDGGNIYIELYGYSKGPGDDRVQVWLYNQTLGDYSLINSIMLDKTWSWKSVGEVSSALSTVARINDAKVYLVKAPAGVEDQTFIDAMRLVPEQKTSDFRATAYTTDLSVTNPTQAYDGDTGTYASFVYSSVAGTKKGLELYNFASPASYPSYNKAPLPTITSVDFHMRYNASLNTGNKNDKYQIVYYVSPSTTAQVLTPLRTDNATYLNVNGFDNTKTGWTRIGSSPYLGNIDYPTNYINQSLITPIIRPDANGFYNTWTIGGTTPAPTRWESVDEATSDSDVTYVYVATTNSKQTFSFSNPTAATWGIGKVRLTAVAKQISPGDERMRLILRIGGADYNGTLFSPTTTGYTAYNSEWDINPATGNPWTWVEINNLEGGVWSEQYGATWDGQIRVTQVYVEVIPEERIGDFSFQDLSYAYEGGKVFVEIYAVQSTPPLNDELDSIEVWVYNQTSTDYFLLDTLTPTNSSSWVTSIDFSSTLYTTALINSAKLYLLKRTNGQPNNVVIDAMRIKVHNPGYIYDPSLTLTWADRPEPNDGVWDMTDVKNIRFAIETSAVTGTSDHGCLFWESEAWVTVTIPKAQLKMPTIKNSALAPQKVTIRPNAEGTYLMMTVFPTTPSTHYDKVDEASQNGDTDYVYATSTGRRETYNLEDPTVQSWEIGSVRVVVYAKYSVAADEKLFSLLFFPGLPIPTANPYTSASSYQLTTSYAMYYWDWGLNPYTSEPWSWSDLASLQAGIAVLATGTWTGELRVTQLYVEILGPRVPLDIRAEGAMDLWGYSLYLNYSTSTLSATAADSNHAVIRPDADTATKQWTQFPASPTTHYDKVNEALTDKDTTYILATGNNLKDVFSLQNPPTSDWLISSIELAIYARQTSGNERIRAILVIGGNTYNGSLVTPPASLTYTRYTDTWTSNPATGSAWTWADIASLQAGVWSEAQGAWGGQLQVTQIYVTIKSYFTDATPSTIDDVQGFVSFGFNMPLGTAFGATGNITLGRVLFVPDALGWSPIELRNTKLTDSRAGVLPHRGFSAIFENSPGAAPVVDVAVLSVTPSATLAYRGYPRTVSVSVKNEGTAAATFDVTVFYNGSSMGTQTVTSLGPGVTTPLTFTWVTTGVPYGYYVISAYATKLTYETDFADNSLASVGMMMLTIPGDINGDKTVDRFDFSLFAQAYGSSAGPPPSGNWNRNADINNDDTVDRFDFSIFAQNYGKTWA